MSSDLEIIQACREKFARGEEQEACFNRVMLIAYAHSKDDNTRIHDLFISFTILPNQRDPFFYRLVDIAIALCSEHQAASPAV